MDNVMLFGLIWALRRAIPDRFLGGSLESLSWQIHPSQALRERERGKQGRGLKTHGPTPTPGLCAHCLRPIT